MNEYFRDDEQQYSPQLRLRIEMVVLTLEEIETQRQRLDVRDCNCLSLSEVREVVATINKAYHYLHELEMYIDQELRRPC